MNFSELFNSVRFPKKTQTPVTKPTYQISADEYNALANKVKEIDENKVFCSLSEYRQLKEEGKVDPNVFYYITNIDEDSEAETI